MPDPGTTVGVEEEFLLADVDGAPVPVASKVLDLLGDAAGFKPELQASQVEFASEPGIELVPLAGALAAARSSLASAAAIAGVCALPVGTALERARVAELPAAARHHAVRQRYAGVVREYRCCGCHVHVGVADRELAVAVVAHLRPWLPTLVALGANSPISDGVDTGYASWRMVEQSRFPGAGMPPYLGSAADYDRQIDRMLDLGVIVDRRMSFWLARLSEVFPTVEVRAADASLSVDDSLLQVALTRALVRNALRQLEAGREAPALDPQACAAAVWSAARYGLDGPAIDLLGEAQVPAIALLESLFDAVTADLDATGDLAAVRTLWRSVRIRGTGAARQRAAARHGGLQGVVRAVAVQAAR